MKHEASGRNTDGWLMCGDRHERERSRPIVDRSKHLAVAMDKSDVPNRVGDVEFSEVEDLLLLLCAK